MVRTLMLTLALMLVAPASGRAPRAAGAQRETPPPAAETSTRAQLRREIEELNRRMVETMKRGDPAGVAAFYADDATIYFSRDKRVRGRKAIDAYWAGLKGGKDWVLEVYEVGGERDAAYEIGRSTFTSEVDGRQSVYACDILVIWQRQKDGQLKIHADFFN